MKLSTFDELSFYIYGCCNFYSKVFFTIRELNQEHLSFVYLVRRQGLPGGLTSCSLCMVRKQDARTTKTDVFANFYAFVRDRGRAHDY
jgi:hypothetical protein